MRIATWNVNSLKARLPRVEEFLGYADVDVLCLQETKLADKAFPALTFSGLGYESVHNGQGQWNGVAILSRVGIGNVTNGFDDAHVDPYEGDARIIAADCGGIRVVSVYVPNGREVGTDFYDRKLVWLQTLHDWIASQHSPDDPIVVLGDFNVAPNRSDVWDPKKFVGATHVTPAERDAVHAAREVGHGRPLPPRVPRCRPPLQLLGLPAPATSTCTAACASISCSATRSVAERVTWAVVDRNARKGTGPSDHAPVIVDLAD